MKNILIYDIECATYGASVNDIHLHKFKYAGAYSYKTNKYYFLQDLDELQELINSHKVIVGFNNYRYDNPILERHGIDFKYKIIIDLYKVMKTRSELIKFKNTFLSYHLVDYKLDTIVKTLGIVNDGKKDIDYKMFDIENPTDEQLKEIKEYAIRDIQITEKLFNYIETEFEGWKHHLSKQDVNKLKHLSSSPSSYAYKVLCERCGFEEEYTNVEEREYQGVGGYVSYPAAEKVEGDIYCLDFSSLYPHIMIQCNLYGRNKNNEEGWNGNGVFKMNGIYNDKEMHIVSKVLMNIYNERKALKKKKDKKEYGLKIVLNTIYGLLRNPVFKNVYDNVAGEDCCIIGQQWIKLARKYFKEEGYFVIYTDTDSVYIKDVYNDKQKIINIKNKIINYIKKYIPFPVDTFDMGIDYEIDMIHFFKGGNKKRESELDKDDIQNQRLGLMKKNYLFVFKENGERKIFIKNLGIVKRTCSQISKKIFWGKMVPEILKTNDCKFLQNQITDWINIIIQDNVSTIAKRITIKEKSFYKSESCIQVQAYNYIPHNSKENLGSGIHYLIPNKRFGFGKGRVKYCLIDEYKKYLTINDLSIDGILRELRYFNLNYKPLNQKEKNLDEMTIQLELW
jgi:DNA polymerase elongation subunit (family B)